MLHKFFFGFLFSVLTFGLFAQGTITGKVLDTKSNLPLPFANVYINHTTMGVQADENGDFSLRNIPFGEHELVASFVGHQPYQSKVTVSDTTTHYLTVKLTPVALKQVEVEAKRDERWNKEYERFQRLFLGTKAEIERCRILNPWVLEFNTDKKGVFSAQASEALRIENLILGYRISYELKSFVVGKANYLILGNVRFEEMHSPDTSIIKSWMKSRADAYWGSSRHLLKALIDNNAEGEGFSVFTDISNFNNVVRVDNFYQNFGKNLFILDTKDRILPGRSPNSYRVQLPPRLEIHYVAKTIPGKVYKDIPHPVSWIEVKERYLDVKKEGVVINGASMIVSGEMSEARVAKILPFNYVPPINKTWPVTLPAKPVKALTFLLERPYLQTDKSYYYKNEKIWFKVYMNYFSRAIKDSMSHVLYVDLIDQNQNILDRKILQIRNGISSGDLPIGNLPEGDYTLRAYTRWMLNFDDQLIFKKPIKILGDNQAVRSRTYEPKSQSENSSLLRIEKDTFTYREKIGVTVEVRDGLDHLMTGNVSIAVTDLEQAVPPAEEQTILNDYRIPEIDVPDSLSQKNFFSIQNGIDVAGDFKPSKGKLTQGVLTFIEKNSNNMFAAISNDAGRFHLTNLIVYDTAIFGVQAKTIKGRDGTVVMDSSVLVPKKSTLKRLSLDVYTDERSISRSQNFRPVKTKELQEVTVEGNRIDVTTGKPYTAADFNINGDWMNSQYFGDLIMALQSKVPGFKVIQGFVLLSGMITSGHPRDIEALVVVDGVVINSDDGNAYRYLSTTSPRQVEKIDILKYGMGAGYGARGANGVIVIYTKKGGDATSNNYDFARLQKIKIPGFATADKFIATVYPSDREEGSDDRSTIYWNPSVTMDGVNPTYISFYAADLPTKYRILIEGITSDGSPVRLEKIISVGPPN